MTTRDSKSRHFAAKLIYAALQILKEKGGECVSSDLFSEVSRRVELSERFLTTLIRRDRTSYGYTSYGSISLITGFETRGFR